MYHLPVWSRATSRSVRIDFQRPFCPRKEKAMAPHSSTLAWKIPWMEEPGGLQSMGSLGVGHNWATSLSFHFHALKKEMANHSSILAWRIPQTEEPGERLLLSCMSIKRGFIVSIYSFLHEFWFPYTFASFFSPTPFAPQIDFFPLLLFCLKMSLFC